MTHQSSTFNVVGTIPPLLLLPHVSSPGLLPSMCTSPPFNEGSNATPSHCFACCCCCCICGLNIPASPVAIPYPCWCCIPPPPAVGSIICACGLRYASPESSGNS